ncbi:Crp/Fnr family transcriptional regulator [Rhizobium sp. L1K21]|uniref:Crp/Fnr family transcriptional regulator n=1 Tax=Rhizobium sp. L1K21 TaxID=2954933 RepID=UPI0020921689|nr:Crp/Fnr family transcriptional regulator [Rhizobium sp. L1K21]MCO6187748.1 Crp/Fnr family transcriptional regulator [Rhizobium sp. L1K21]
MDISYEAQAVPLRQSEVKNKLLNRLPSEDFARIAPDLTFERLPRGVKIARAGAPIEHIYFLNWGVGSVIMRTPLGHSVEAGLFGADGYVPTSAMSNNSRSPADVEIQIEADAYRMSFSNFRNWMNSDTAFPKIIMAAIEAFLIQVSYTAVSNAIHSVNERLARWLLMCDDRIPGHEISITHEYLSLMLAVRRASVTDALHILEGKGFIRGDRGRITIVNRSQLEAYAHDAYGRTEEAYRKLMDAL